MIRIKTKKIKSVLLICLLSIPLATKANEDEENFLDKNGESEGYCINFHDVPIIEFVRFVSRISEENFIFDSKDLDFNVSLSTGKSISTPRVVQALIQLLKMHGMSVTCDEGYYVIHKSDEA